MAEDSRHKDSQSHKEERGESQASGKGGSAGPVKSSHIIEEHIEVGVPREVAYAQWTQYRDLPKYSKKESAELKRENRISFTSKIGPSTRHWDADIVEQVPPRRIAWRSVGGARSMGVVTFHELSPRLTRVMVQMEYHPQGAVEVIGNFFRMQRRRVRKDLRLFKHFIDLRGEATGKAAGEIKGPGLVDEADEHLEGSSTDDGNSTGRSGERQAS